MKNFFAFVFLLVLSTASSKAQNCSPQFNQLANGQNADANQVMANFNALLTCINSNLALPGYINGLTLSTDAQPKVLRVAAGLASSDDNVTASLMRIGDFTKNGNAQFAEGMGNGALANDSGSQLAANTWYHVYLIQRADTGAVDILISQSPTSPTLPTSFGRKRRIGSIRTDPAGNIMKFIQNGDQFLWLTPVPEAIPTSGNPPTLPAALTQITLTVPTGVRVNALFRSRINHNASGFDVTFGPPDAPPAGWNIPNGNASLSNSANQNDGAGEFNILTNLSAQIDVYPNVAFPMTSASPGPTLNIATYGWVDTRGK
jgi:hypothetical protein